MSEDFEVRGAHDAAVDEASEHGLDRFSSRIAVTTAVLATVGAMCAYMAGSTQTMAQLDKNNAAIKKTAASDQWNFFQAKSNKQNLAELAVVLAPAESRDKFRGDITRYATEKNQVKAQAEALEKESDAWDEQSEHEMHIHHNWAKATTLLQVAIAVSAIALLTRRRWMQWLIAAFAAAGMVFAVVAML